MIIMSIILHSFLPGFPHFIDSMTRADSGKESTSDSLKNTKTLKSSSKLIQKKSSEHGLLKNVYEKEKTRLEASKEVDDLFSIKECMKDTRLGVELDNGEGKRSKISKNGKNKLISVANQERSNSESVRKSAPSSISPQQDDDGVGDTRGLKKKIRPLTDDGLPIFTWQEMGIGRGGDTPDCPFDCDCCF